MFLEGDNWRHVRVHTVAFADVTSPDFTPCQNDATCCVQPTSGSASNGHGSHKSPAPSPSASAWSWFVIHGQLSAQSGSVSLSWFGRSSLPGQRSLQLMTVSPSESHTFCCTSESS